MLEKNVKLENKTILVTGAAGFIGANLILSLLKNVEHVEIIGIDNMNAYYDVALKEFRLNQIRELASGVTGTFTFIRESIAEQKKVKEIFETHRPQIVVNLAAQAGVRYSIENPDAYIESNMIGFYNLLEHAGTAMTGGQAVSNTLCMQARPLSMEVIKDTLRDRGQSGQSCIALRCHQEIQRTDGACLRKTLWHSIDRTSLFYRVWSGRAPGYGIFWLYRQACQE